MSEYGPYDVRALDVYDRLLSEDEISTITGELATIFPLIDHSGVVGAPAVATGSVIVSPPMISARGAVAASPAEVLDIGIGGQTYFLPPALYRRVPKAGRDGLPRSPRYRDMIANDVAGEPLVIDGISYERGRWNGPLTGAEIAAIRGAGYEQRLITVNDASELPGEVVEG